MAFSALEEGFLALLALSPTALNEFKVRLSQQLFGQIQKKNYNLK
jgi:hypothetical protein